MRLIRAILQITLLGTIGAALGALLGHFGFLWLIKFDGHFEEAGFVYPAVVVFTAFVGAGIGVMLSTLVDRRSKEDETAALSTTTEITHPLPTPVFGPPPCQPPPPILP